MQRKCAREGDFNHHRHTRHPGISYGMVENYGYGSVFWKAGRSRSWFKSRYELVIVRNFFELEQVRSGGNSKVGGAANLAKYLTVLQQISE
jgi:hypothetical protein